MDQGHQKSSIDYKKKILVTGGTGFLGSYLLRFLLQEGYQNIWALHRPTSDFSWIADIKSRIHWIECDILDILGLEDALDGVVEIYHSAAFISFLRSERKKMLQINVEGTANLVDIALFKGVKRLLNVSSVAALGRSKPIETLNEKNQWERSPFNTYYGLSKYLAEQEAWRGFAEGLEVVVVNPSMILGSHYWDYGTANFFSMIDKGLKFYPMGGNGFVDVRDVVRLMHKLMESGISGERYIANQETLAYQELFQRIAHQLNTNAPRIKVNAFLRELALYPCRAPSQLS